MKLLEFEHRFIRLLFAYVVPNFANCETQKTKPHPKRQKLAALAASIASSSKREKRAMKRRKKVTDEINALSMESVDVQRDEESTEDKRFVK